MTAKSTNRWYVTDWPDEHVDEWQFSLFCTIWFLALALPHHIATIARDGLQKVFAAVFGVPIFRLLPHR